MNNPAIRRNGPQWSSLLLALTIFSLLTTVWLFTAPQARALRANDPVSAAWARAREAGSYRFNGDVLQVTTPSSSPANVGRASQTDQLYLTGQIELRQRTAEMQLWAADGAISRPESGIGVRVEDGKTFVREGGGAWQERAGFTDSFAPEGDVMAYLVAARDVVSHAPETRADVTFTRLTFRLDGPAFGAAMRDQLERAMRREQAVPEGVRFDIPAYYRDMVGSGELWVGQDGLPIRQILSLRFPEQGGESVSAQITMSFTGFSAPQGMGAALAALPAALPGAMPQLALLLFVFGLAWTVRHFGGKRWLHMVLVVTVISSLVGEPVLRGLKVRSFLNAQAAHAAERQAEQTEQQQLRDMRAAMTTSSFDPHADPLAAPTTPAAAQTGAAQVAAADTTDTDGDGLTDYQEVRIGLDPTFADTDEDGLRDSIEATGVTFGGKTWYLDANNIDSNGDGIGDGQEWDNDANGQPDDTDADGIPDAFDADNDGDGVPDAKDLSPFVKGTQTVSDASPLALKVNNLAAGTPAFVDFQLRPTDPKHLQFAFNVLDWPRADSLGQVRDIDSFTYADVARSQGRTPDANESFGDMKLIPMLEIRIPVASANLPSQRDLSPYNISFNDFTVDGATKVAYVPLSIVTDEKTGARVAFSGRMRYQPTGSWATAHQVRLAWVVQALNDRPCPADATTVPGCVQYGYKSNQPDVIQTYYDDWTLTGLSVKEDHGAGVAIVYEDPAVDTNLKDDSALTALSAGLDNAFLTARDDDANGVRDITLAEIARRFDRTGNAAVTEDQRWAIPNILRVERKEYPVFDQAVSSTAMTETVRILNSAFRTPWQNDPTIRPLLLFAQETRARSVGLDSARAGGGYATLSGGSLTVDFRPAGQTAAPLVVTSHLQWTPFCGASGPTWNPCSMDSWWGELEHRSPASVVLSGDDPSDTDLASGRIAAMKIYHTQLMQGVSRAVQWDSSLAPRSYTVPSDSTYAGYVRTVLKTGGPAVVKEITNTIFMARYVNKITVLKQLGVMWKELKAGAVGTAVAGAISILRDFRGGGALVRLQGTALVVGAAVLLAGAITLAVFFFKGDVIAGAIVSNAIRVISIAYSLYSSIYKPISTIIELTSAASSLLGSNISALRSVLTMSSDLTGVTRAVGVAGTIFSIAVTWGFFIYSMAINQVSAFSPEFNRALAETIAATIYAILLLVLSAMIIGALLVGLIAVIDTILAAICEWGVTSLRQVSGLNGACFSISGIAVKGIAYNLYNYSPMIDLTKPELMAVGAPDIQFADPAKGFRSGNRLTVTMPITTTVIHKNPDPKDGLLIYPYLWLYSPDSIRSSTFKYRVAIDESLLPDLSAERNQMTATWQDVREDHKFVATPMYRGQANTTPPPITDLNLAPGINQTIPIELKMAYAIPAYECWGLIAIGACYRRELANTNTASLEPLRFDVFPETLDGFMALSARPNSNQGLAWSAFFPALKDADGDGLMAAGQGGLDPNDTTPDTDGDGLSDRFELDRRSNGAAFNASACDTDGDGLTDGQEAQFGANPALADSDQAGLTDAEEVWHAVYNTTICQPTGAWSGGWNVSVNDGATTLTVNVSSNLLLADSDGDGSSDSAEKQLAATNAVDSLNFPYHPGVYNAPPLAVITSVSDLDGVVGLGQTFTYTTTVVTRVQLNSGSIALSLPADLSAPTPNRSLGFNPLTFTTAQTVTEQFAVTVAGNATPGTKAITSQVTAQPSAGGQITASGGLSLFVDAAPPSSTITSIQDGQYIQGSAPGQPVTVIIGGSASDARSEVSKVEVSGNGGPWQAADGAATWSFPLAVEDGGYTVQTRATDGAGNVETPGAGITVKADGFAPDVNFLNSPSAPAVPLRTASGQWSIGVGGFVSDPQAGLFSGNGSIYAGSGVVNDSVRVRIRLTSDVTSINTWQPVTIAGGQWSATYVFPVSVADPTGAYTVEIEARDTVGGVKQRTEELVLDATAPIVTLSQQDSARASIASAVTLSGVITDANSLVGIDTLDTSFAPLAQVVPLSDAVMRLRFEEPAGSISYADGSGYGNVAVCDQAPACPTAGGAGRIGRALTFSGAQIVRVADAPSLSFDGADGFSVMGWIKTSQSDAVIMRKGNGASTLFLGLAGGAARLTLGDGVTQTTVSGGPALNDNQWHFVVGVVNRTTGFTSIYVDGVTRSSTPVSGSFASADAMQIGGQTGVAGQPSLFLVGALDDLAVIGHALSATEVQALFSAADRVWLSATLAQRGAGKATSSWSLTVPADLEGVYQLDARAADMLGNRSETAKLWRGVIDTRAPRVVLTATPTGAVYFDAALGGYRAAVTYACATQDQYLNEASFSCPGTNLPPAVRSFDNDPILQGLLPDLTVRSGLGRTYTVWEPVGQLTRMASACDTGGRCTTANTPVSLAALTPGAPRAVVASPASQAFVTASPLSVVVVADADQPLKQVTLSLDGQVVDTASFAQGDAVKSSQRTVSVPVSGEGPHSLVATATDWTGRVQTTLFPVLFILDTQAPAVAIAAAPLTVAQTYGPGSDVLRFSGTASDANGLASVQISINGGPFVDATFDNADWRAAIRVTDPEGAVLSVVVRATDTAGRTTEVTRSLTVNISTPNPPDTAITDQPASTSTATAASFRFTGTPGARGIGGYECRIDGGTYQPCADLTTYPSLSLGQHTFSVRAIDSEGYVDPSPASYTWTITAPDYTIWLPLIVR